MPGTQITDEDKKKIDAKFICTLCGFLLNSPMQTSCGHLMCFACLQTLLESLNPSCPEDGTELKREEVFPDAFTKRELKSVKLHCTNAGCQWYGTYEELEGHSGVCQYTLIDCVHTQCKTKLQRLKLGKHLENECEYRDVKCRHCGVSLPIAAMKQHVDTSCEAAPVVCRHCKKEVLRKDIKQHEEQVCEEIPAKCDFQAVGCKHDKVLRRKELRQHMHDGIIHHAWLLLHFIQNFVSQLVRDYVPRVEFSEKTQAIREEVSGMWTACTEKCVKLVEKVTGLERRVETLESTGGIGSRVRNELQEVKTKSRDLNTELASVREKCMGLERELREKNTIIERLQSRMDQMDEALAVNTVKISDMESASSPAQVIHSYNGTLLWKIDNFQRKRQEAIGGIKTALYSPHFYSSQFGFKMCAKIYMNGDGFGKGSHLSLFFVVMKGEYDALLTWPFQKKITMMLLDQGNGDHMIDAFHSDPQSSSFQRPKSDMNIASGSPLFMPIDNLNNRAYIKDDVMFIKIIVD